MGQYYRAVLVNREWKVKVIKPSGWKLMEHSWYGNESMNRIQKILSEDVWSVYWVWDYSKMSALVWQYKFEDVEEFGWDEELPKEQVIDIREDKENDYFLVNETHRQYINMSKQIKNKELFEDNFESVIHPLPLLCRNETEEAGWDYHSDVNKDLIGCWEWDEIRIIKGKEWEEYLIWHGYKDCTDFYFFKE